MHCASSTRPLRRCVPVTAWRCSRRAPPARGPNCCPSMPICCRPRCRWTHRCCRWCCAGISRASVSAPPRSSSATPRWRRACGGSRRRGAWASSCSCCPRCSPRAATGARSARPCAARSARVFEPGQAGAGVGAGPVLQADGARPAALLQQGQLGGVFLRRGLMPADHAGQLHMAEQALVQRPAEVAQRLALADPAVVEVELQLHPRRVQRGQQVQGLRLSVQEIARHVAPVDRLDRQPEAGGRLLGGPAEIGEPAVARRATVLGNAGQQVHHRRTDL
mmetsp:Transcript_62039/g.146950  ORF Transcript_62039/g.146950 Transcript_62039/m.146950 type:complete len:278 (+) Transcript_62039:1308-2141(+)